MEVNASEVEKNTSLLLTNLSSYVITQIVTLTRVNEKLIEENKKLTDENNKLKNVPTQKD